MKSSKMVIKTSKRGMLKRSTIIILSVVGVIALGVGVTAAIILPKFTNVPTADIESVNMSDVRPVEDNSAMDRYSEVQGDDLSSHDYSQDFRAAEIFDIAYKLFSSHEVNSSITVGESDAGIVKQSIRAATVRNNNQYFEESISKSLFVSLAHRIYQEDDSVKLYAGSAKTQTEGTYKEDEYTTYTGEEYAELYGKTPSRPLIYNVNSKTILPGSTVTKTETGYKVEISLNTTEGVYDYMHQMKNISDLSGYPKFEYCNLTLYTDETLLAKKLHVEECYTAKMGLFGSKCTAKMDIAYYVDNGATIPELDDPTIYPESIEN